MNLSKSLYRHIFHNIYFEKKKKIFFRFFEIFRVEYPLKFHLQFKEKIVPNLNTYINTYIL